MNIVVTTSFWLFLAVVMTPGQWVPVKFALLLMLSSFGLTYRYFDNRPVRLNQRGALYLALLAVLYLATLFGLWLGFYRGNPGAIDNIGIYFVYPFIWASFFLVNGLEATKKILIKTSLYAGVALSILILMAAFLELMMGLDPSDFSIFNAFEIVAGSQFGGFKLSAKFLPYLIFSFVMLLEIGIAKTNRSESSNIISRKKAFAAAILILVALALSGRSAMLICIIWFVVRSIPYFLASYKGIAGLLTIFVVFVWLLDFNQISLALQSKLNLTSETSEIGMRRISQLFEGFQLVANKPFLGHGVGHYFESVGDWRIEITPVTVLISHGLFVSVALVLFYLFVLRRLVRCCDMHYVANASFLFIVASATNPILLKFDFIWILLVPFVIYGMVLFQSDRNNPNASSV